MEICPDASDRADADNALLLFQPEDPPRVECLHSAHPLVAEPRKISRPVPRNHVLRGNRILSATAFASGLAAGSIIAVLWPTAQPQKLEAEAIATPAPFR